MTTGLSELRTAANRLAAGLRMRVLLTAVAALREHQHDDHPLDANVWLWLGIAQRAAELGLLAEQTAQSMHHSLFPTERP
jgi:hypothetical protein